MPDSGLSVQLGAPDEDYKRIRWDPDPQWVEFVCRIELGRSVSTPQ